ncbi:MAG: prephenate dehydratase, partial [Treponema sp.]|nr:prephenate dehydratase [Treponema sp.]
ILCERGIRTYEQATRNTLDLSAIPVLRSMTHLPIIVDPSHALGVRDKIPPMALASIAAGADGIIVEVHCHPEQALSDAAQALYPAQFDKIMRDMESLAPVMGKEVAHIRSADSQKKANAGKAAHKKPVCVFSGMKGAYAEQAIENFFEDSVEAQTVDSFDEIFQAVVDGKAEYGMVPIENSTAGSVYNNYDNLTRYEDISIVGALTLRIQHSLLGVKGATLETIKNVYSHPQGLSQCSNFLKSQKWNAVDTVSTATAANLVAEKKSKENAAICNARNAAIYGLEVIKEGIQNEQNNYTRFVVIAANHVEEPLKQWSEQKPNMASFVFTTKNEAGALYDALGIFKEANLSMNRLESRPIAGKPWKYWFYCDVVIGSDIENPVEYISDFSNKLKSAAEDVRILGVYAE